MRNSHYRDTERRAEALAGRGIGFVGAGISGGAEGARRGPSIMAGGSGPALQRVGPIFQAIAARYRDEACYAHLGPAAAGHFVKTMHNGIEYAVMQLVSEAYLILRHQLRLPIPEIRNVFARWQETTLGSYLVGITAEILGKTEPDSGAPLLDKIADEAEQKGTGHWALTAALEHSTSAPLIAAAVLARQLATDRHGRTTAQLQVWRRFERFRRRDKQSCRGAAGGALCVVDLRVRTGLRGAGGGAPAAPLADRLATGGSDAAGGCVIRSSLLDRVVEVYERTPELANPMWDEAIASTLSGGAGLLEVDYEFGDPVRHPDTGVVVGPRLLRCLSQRAARRESDPGAAGLFREARIQTDRSGGRFSSAVMLAAGRRVRFAPVWRQARLGAHACPLQPEFQY